MSDNRLIRDNPGIVGQALTGICVISPGTRLDSIVAESLTGP